MEDAMSLRTAFSRFTTAAIMSVAVGSSAAAQANTLYKRIGGYDAIAAVTDDFIERWSTTR
jgi:hypothetical protein